MKKVSKTIGYILPLFLFVNLAQAQTFGFELPNVLKNAKEVVTGVFSEIGNKTSELTKTENVKEKELEMEDVKISKSELNSCQKYDNTFLNTLVLDQASFDTKVKIEKISDTLEDEMLLREAIFHSKKSLTELQKKEKVIFREIKKELENATKYYEEVDEIVEKTTEKLASRNCDEFTEKEVDEVYDKTGDLVIDESTYRKQFIGTLKEKMNILQKEVKGAKK